MSTMKSHIAQAIKIFGIMTIVAAFAAAAFPTRSFAAEPTTGKLVVNVYEISAVSPGTSGTPIANANIEIFDSNGRSVAIVDAGSTGSTSIELPKGVYKVTAAAKGYTSATASATVNVGKTTNVKIALKSLSRIAR